MSAPLYQAQVAFYETDAAGIVHFSNYLRYAEQAEIAALQQSGFLAACMKKGFILPRVKVQVDYMRPLRFLDAYEIAASLTRIGASSLHWYFEIQSAGQTCATLHWISARRDADGKKLDFTDEERQLLTPLLKK